LLWIISLPIALFICLTAKPLICLLAGDEYLESALPMRLLIWISALSFLSIQFRFLFTAIGRQRLFARLVLAIFLLEAVIEWALIPRWGYMGACAGSLIGELIFTCVGLVLCSYLGVRGFQWGAMVRAVLAGVAMAAVIWPGRDLPILVLIPLGASGVCVYFGLCLWLGALGRDELRQSFDALAAVARAPARTRHERLAPSNSHA
jgi:O-antigen/teichoic acid export membrane protein